MKGFSKFVSKITALISSLVLTCTITMTTVADATDTTETSDLLQCDHIVELSDGGKIYVYYINGIENTFPVPPEGFNPIVASDEALATYGFPPRPTDLNDLDNWTKDMSAYKYTPVPEIKVSDVVYGVDQPVKMQEKNAAKGLDQTTGSYNWSGYIAKGNYVMMQADFIQPSVNASDPYYTHEGTWIGFGGYGGSNKLVQTGTGMGRMPSGNYYYAWYELISPTTTNPPVVMSSVTVNPGDSIHLYCSFQQANNKFNAYIANNTNGTAQSVLVNDIPASDYFDSSTAEFINEKPSVTGTDNGLSNYVTTNWWNCQVYSMSNVWYNLGSTTYNKEIMYTLSGIKRAEPSGLSGKTFISTWYHY